MTQEGQYPLAYVDTDLDAALAQALNAPKLPADFRERLRAALSRSNDTENIDMQRARLEREHRENLAALANGYRRLCRRTLCTLIGGTILLGAGVSLGFPWLSAAIGAHAFAVVALFGGMAGLVMGVGASRGRQRSLIA